MDAREKLIQDLAKDFKRWGRVATKRIQEATKKAGVIYNSFVDPTLRNG